MSVPLLELNSGNKMPALGLGTFDSKSGVVQKSVESAIDSGYRHLDCAWLYKNENEVGEAIAIKVKQNKIKREDLFITSKLWNSFHNPKYVRDALQQTLDDLKTDYLDLYLMHFPYSYVNVHDPPETFLLNVDKASNIFSKLQNKDCEMFPKGEDGKMLHDDTDYIDTWKAMEELKKEGLVRDIGISNFNKYQINRLLKNCSIKPVVNQVELNPYLTQPDLVDHCKKNGIVVTAYSPLGSPERPWAKPDDPKLLEDPRLKAIADRVKKSVAQVLIKFPLQRGLSVIPKSATPSRIHENFQVFDFELSDDDMKTISSFNRNFRAVAMQTDADHKYYPFRDNYSE